MRKASRILFLWALLLQGCGASQDAQPAGDAVSASNQPVETDHFLSRQRTHNRWNRDLEPILTIQSGQTVRVETRDASDGHFSPDSTTADVASRDRGRIHPLTGPIRVEGAEPGDVLQVDILGFELPEWGWTAVAPPGGFLAEELEGDYLHIWRFDKEAGYTEFKPGIRVPLRPFLGVIGLAWDEEGEFRTFPPRAQGGNMDIRHLTAGTTVYLPVALAGALLSVGDGHAAQGDGEVAISAIECDLTARLRVTLRKDLDIQEPHYEGPGFYATTGFATSIDEAARKATRYMLDYLSKHHNLTRHEAYVLASAAVDLQINETVDMPHYLVSARLPKAVFE